MITDDLRSARKVWNDTDLCHRAANEIERLRDIEAAARNLCSVKGRHRSEIAMHKLMQACGIERNNEKVSGAGTGDNEMTTPIAQGPVDVNVGQGGCLLCAGGNDLPEGEHCRACGCGLSEPAAAAKTGESNLAAAIKAARGGDAPIPFKGYA